jgi:hypothetical protein
MSLYKYIASERLDDILKEGSIRFTQPGDFNDPFEMLPYLEKFFDFPAMFEQSKIDPQVNDTVKAHALESFHESPLHAIIPEEMWLRMYDVMMPHLIPFATKVLDMGTEQISANIRTQFPAAFNQNIGVLCLTEKPDNLLMWAHYSDCHRGLVLEFDESHSFFNQRKSETDELRYLRKVIYSAQRPVIRLPNLTYEDLCLTKSLEWEYEQEWRIIVALQDADATIERSLHNICLFKIPVECITAIILGARATDETRDAVIDLLNSDEKYSHIRLKEAIVEERTFGVIIAESPRYTAELLKEFMDHWLSPANRDQDEDYDQLVKDLTHFEIFSLALLEDIVVRYLQAVVLDDQENAKLMLADTFTEGEARRRAEAGMVFSHTGLLRGVISLEFGERWEEYRKAMWSTKEDAATTHGLDMEALRFDLMQLRPDLLAAMSTALRVPIAELEELERQMATTGRELPTETE